jgi:SOS-response transcriptional repressor LexA
MVNRRATKSNSPANAGQAARAAEGNGAVSDVAVREQLDALIRQSGQGYADVSRLIGRNAAYVQQFIKRGVPRRLGEQERRLLAAHFGVAEALLGGPPQPAGRIAPEPAHHVLIEVPFLSAQARPLSAAPLRIDGTLLARLSAGRAASLAAMVVEGDSMAPTLLAGDHLLVDLSDNTPARDGLYAIESDSTPVVKRLSVNPATHRVAILSDNVAYPSFPDCLPDSIGVLGRIVWMGRPLG